MTNYPTVIGVIVIAVITVIGADAFLCIFLHKHSGRLWLWNRQGKVEVYLR